MPNKPKTPVRGIRVEEDLRLIPVHCVQGESGDGEDNHDGDDGRGHHRENSWRSPTGGRA
jgi:hypothetical protein